MRRHMSLVFDNLVVLQNILPSDGRVFDHRYEVTSTVSGASRPPFAHLPGSLNSFDFCSDCYF